MNSVCKCFLMIELQKTKSQGLNMNSSTLYITLIDEKTNTGLKPFRILIRFMI